MRRVGALIVASIAAMIIGLTFVGSASDAAQAEFDAYRETQIIPRLLPEDAAITRDGTEHDLRTIEYTTSLEVEDVLALYHERLLPAGWTIMCADDDRDTCSNEIEQYYQQQSMIIEVSHFTREWYVLPLEGTDAKHTVAVFLARASRDSIHWYTDVTLYVY